MRLGCEILSRILILTHNPPAGISRANPHGPLFGKCLQLSLPSYKPRVLQLGQGSSRMCIAQWRWAREHKQGKRSVIPLCKPEIATGTHHPDPTPEQLRVGPN